jgi:hypothetical protein
MDLGTVKNKLTKKQYVSIEEFAADVRLTFSNAMKYNPPENDVHKVAKELNGIFDSEWESVERKFRVQNPVQEQQTMKAIKVRGIMDSKSTVPRELVACSNSKPLIARGPVACSNLIAKKTLTDALSSKVRSHALIHLICFSGGNVILKVLISAVCTGKNQIFRAQL